MIKYKFQVPLFRFQVTLLQVEHSFDTTKVLRILSSIHTDEALKTEIMDTIQADKYNGGITIRNTRMRSIITVFFRMKTLADRAEVYSHEKRHIEDRILEWASVDDIETSAFLAGYLGREFMKFQNLIDKSK